MEQATFAGGCFWCTEAIFKRLKGVSAVVSGYTGGQMNNPSYQDVSSGETGHAEAIHVTFDSSIISYNKLVEIFFATHDPTALNRQGADVGTQYRSAIYYHSDAQKKIAERVKDEFEKSGRVKNKIVTEIHPFSNFFQAEQSHQDFYENNRYYPYCQIVIDPKVTKLLNEYSADVKKEFQK